jgi:acyl CoA:acetate/3-ketoacid CoA transferase
VLGRVAIPLRVSPDLCQMDERLFRPECMRLALRAGEEKGQPKRLRRGREKVASVG